MTEHKRIVSVVGLGYVGLPVAVAFGKVGKTIGFDINDKRIAELKSGHDCTGEVPAAELKESDILFTNKIEDLRLADFHIIAVPTPVDDANPAGSSLLLRASETVQGSEKGDIIVMSRLSIQVLPRKMRRFLS
jgi:UDP-N-acetyl-D-galactosamine dehydrogenase